MKKSNYSFAEGFFATPAIEAKARGAMMMVFDWDKCAQIIKQRFAEHPDLTAEAGLQGDWNYTGGDIFSDGQARKDSYTYLASNWATPTLILSWDREEQEEIECFCDKQGTRFNSESKWD